MIYVLKDHLTAGYSFKYTYFLDTGVSVVYQMYKVFAPVKLTF